MIKLALALSLLSSTTASPAPSLAEAEAAYDNSKIAESARLFAVVAADPAAPKDDRANAGISLARIAWLIDGDADLALKQLEVARATGKQSCEIGQMTSRVLREAKRYQQVLDAQSDLIQACSEPAGRDAIRTNVIGAELDLAESDPSNRTQMLARAKADAKLLGPDSGLEGARMRLEVGLLTGDAQGALSAWKDFFWLDRGDAPQAMTGANVAQTFTSGLAADAGEADRLKLTELLMRAGFGEQSHRFAIVHGLPGTIADSPVWRRLQAYWTERDKLEAGILRINRTMAHGQSDEGAIEARAKSAMVNLMQAAGASGDPKVALRKYYGLVGTVGKTNGYPSMHLGHVVEDRDQQVTQYGHSAELHFIALDNMISNGFSSWLWDGSASVGGWEADGTIIQVRPAYMDGPLESYRLTKDGPERRKLLERQARRAVEDIAKLKQRRVATLDGLNDRLQLQVADEIAATVRSRATGEADFRRRFLAEFARGSFEHSIMLHEGRHAIDATLGLAGKVDQSVLEYDAKLSELALATYPRMALYNIDRTLDGDGPHDKAGAQIFDGYRKWMEAHVSEIAGYDRSIPALEQLDKLTDPQIRQVARSLDPLAGSAPATASAGSPCGTSRRSPPCTGR